MSLVQRLGRAVAARLAPHSFRATAAPGNVFYSATPQPVEDDDDVVMANFKHSVRATQAFLEGMQKVPVPLDTDKEGIKKYAAELEALRNKVGLPSVDRLMEATMDYKLACSGGNLHTFIAEATKGRDMGKYSGAVAELEKIVTDVEENFSDGKPLAPTNEQAWQELDRRITAFQKEHNLEDYERTKSEAIVETYENTLAKVRSEAIERMEAAKQKDGLEWVQIDPKDLKPDW